MLQPREQHRIPFILVFFRITLCITFICIKTGLAQHSDDVYIVEPTPALRLNNQDLTTILLLNNNNNRANYGRHSNVKPTVGLLTSTARTFIQEGVTTEYATQVLGTTLDNGRLYAQLLKKSSRVLYDKNQPTLSPTSKFPGAVQSLQTYSAKNPKSILQSHNDIIGDKDWQLIDDHLLLINNNMPQRTDSNGGGNASKQSNGSLLVFPAKSSDNNNVHFNDEQRSVQRFANYSSSSRSSSSSNARNNISAQKVLHPGNLPTYTIKNIFAPSGFSWDSPIEDTYLFEDKGDEEAKSRVELQQRTPKLLQHDSNILSNKFRNMVTTTYFGFADFTTIVGDTVIVFSPSTSAEHEHQGQVTSIKGEATLNDSPQETAFITHVPITVTEDLIEPTFTMQHVVQTVQPTQTGSYNEELESPSGISNEEENDEGRDQSDLTMPEDPNDYSSDDDNSVEEYMTTTEGDIPQETTPFTHVDIQPNEEDGVIENHPIITSSQIELEPSILASEEGTSQASYVTETTSKVMLSKPSNEDISKIFASLASAEAAKKLAASIASPASIASSEMIATDQATTNPPEKDTSPAVTTTTSTTTDMPIENETTEHLENRQQFKSDFEGTTNESIIVNDDQSKLNETIDSYIPTLPNDIDSDEEATIIPESTSETKISGGVTTIFFEDDPFLGFEPTTTLRSSEATTMIDSSVPSQPSTTEGLLTDKVAISEQLEESAEAVTEEPVVNAIPAINETSENGSHEVISSECQEKTSDVIPTLVPKTLTYLTTFFLSDSESTSTSVESNVVVTFDVSYSTKLYCMEIVSTAVVDQQVSSTDVVITGTLDSTSDHSNIDQEELSSSIPTLDDEEMITTTPHMIITEKAHITTEETPSLERKEEKPHGPLDDLDENEEISTEQSDEEIELIYKTLYTTYTYLTTFFHESTTSVSSRKEIITNVITTTVSPSSLQNNVDVTEILSSVPSSFLLDKKETVLTASTTENEPVAKSDLAKIDNILREDEEQVSPTASLDDETAIGNGLKTYYTTYTYFTTIFVDGETEIMSRTEVYTNLVSEPSGNIEPSIREKDSIELTVRDDDNKIVNDITPTSTYSPPVYTNTVRLVDQALSELSQNEDKYRNSINTLESSVVSSSTSSSADESEIVMVTDIKSSSSDGDRHIIENINKHWNGLLEDQISSESNTDEIVPSSTLLLQTSYTTFTYFTTMYIGSTSSNILSRLETITNVVTETLQPTQMLKAEDSTLPITYFTTFTYWTTLYKDGETTTISREETVSNVVTPTAVLEQLGSTETVPSSVAPDVPDPSSELINTTPLIQDTTSNDDSATTALGNIIETTRVKSLQPTTFYTTYTYFTTQYVGNETVINSRFETVTNVNTQNIETNSSTLEALEGTSSATFNPSATVSSVSEESIETTTETPPGETIIELNQGKIVDAEGISTLFYTTKTVATQIDNELTTIVMSTSTLNVDSAKKALISSTQTDASTRTYKTGLVRLIDGTIVANLTTTLYQSKVIGTIIDGRYAQIIESTSSFLIEKTLAPTTPQIEIQPTSVKTSADDVIQQTAFIPTLATSPVEGSINDGAEEKDQDQFEDNGEDEDDNESNVDESGRPKSRLTFQSRKKTFTPVIRPFASRNRPQFAPKRKNGAGGSATIITRSDFTPTITATPALKSESSRGRFSSNRKGGSSVLNSGAVSGSSRKFSRPGGVSSSRGFASSSSYQGSSRRGFSSSRIQPTASSYYPGGSRRGGASSQRSGSSNFVRGGASSLFSGNSRLRVKPTSVLPAEGQTNTNIYTTQEPENEEAATQVNAEADQEDTEITTEALRRPNSLVKLRRPPLGVSQRKNPLTQRAKPKTTTTTTTPKPQPRSFQRPSLPAFGNRQRSSSGLFPPRSLFKPQAINEDLSSNKKEDEENDFGDDLDPEDYDDDEEVVDDDLERNRRNNIKRHVRAKRQAPSFRNRFRRPSKNEEKVEPVEEEPVTQRSRTTARYSGSRNNNKKSNQNKNNGRIRPTKASSSTRAQFTLREKDTNTKQSRSNNFRRPTTSSSSGSRRTSTTAGRPKAPRLKAYSNSVTEAPYSSRSTAGRSRQTTSRGRSTTRSRGTTEFKNNDPVLPAFDGTITVTHHIPTEVTIPVVNGKVTEYKNIITAQIRTEVLAPNQYNTLVDRGGSSLLVLAREDSTVNSNGATEVTQFILHETPTTSVIFTPTTIRGRKTSFSHIIPSTVYDVENVVSTIQPQIAAQAPLANILLSQLLLGNIGLPQQQINPALIGLGQTGGAGTPTTEFKTRTTSYVTTVTNEMSTVIPLTFRGKEILTTIFDSSVNVITATEYITDTIVVTPAAAAVQQVNSLLLPLLLQQQAQGAQPLLPIQNSIAPQLTGNDPLLNTVAVQQQNLFQDNNFRSDADLNRIQQVNLDDFHDAEGDELPEQETFREAATETTRSRKRHHRKADKSISTTPLASPYQNQLETSAEIPYLIPEDSDSGVYSENGRFFNFKVFDGLESSTPTLPADEARYNLATRIMSNGVEVIVAGDKTKTSVDRNTVLRILPSNLYKPMTLAPSTLKNQMILIDPSDSEENLTLPFDPHQFVTKTCLTTYTYRTTYLQDGTTTIESREKVISNIATEERNYPKISPTSAAGITLSRTPEFVIGVFHTTYTYLNTILDGDLPIVLSSKHTVTNTITGPEDYISFLQPSEEATPVQETNTYFSKITLTKTLHESQIDKIVSTSNVLRQVVITESLPSKSTSVMTSYIALDSEDDKVSAYDFHIYATKTYLTTFTYFTTVLKSQQQQSALATEINSHIRVVENVITESIPNHMLQQEALSSFRKQLELTSTRTITALATLVGGQTLEVTAMKTPNMPHSSQLVDAIDYGSSSAEFPEKYSLNNYVNTDEDVTIPLDESKDEENEDSVGDNIVAASSDHEEHLYNVIEDSPPKNHTKNKDKNGFQVSSLISSFNLNGLNALGPMFNAMAGLINTNFVSPVEKDVTQLKLSTNEISSKNLLKNITSFEPGTGYDQTYFEKHRMPIYIPVRSSNDVVDGNRLSSPSSLHIAPPKPQSTHQQKFLLQTDEKANRNNKLEILVGKPTYETPLLNGGIPISPGEVITANSDVIIGKPAGIRPRIPFQTLPSDEVTGQMLPHLNRPTSPKVIPLLSYHAQQNFQRPTQTTTTLLSYKPNYQVHTSLQNRPIYPSRYPSRIHHAQNSQGVQSDNYHVDAQHPLNNEILEIKRIPEVYSADLPIFEMKKIRANADKTMLVNIQPSQVASVMIPHGNTAPVLIIESTPELHKNGQYFDEPSPYPNSILGVEPPVGYTSHGRPLNELSKHKLFGIGGASNNVAETANAPVQVNLDSSVLSHNIDVHVPPLTFIKENEFPESTPVRGQNFNFKNPNQHKVSIPYYNQHVTVNVRPQHESPNNPHFQRTQHYPVQGMEPPPKNSRIVPVPPKKLYYHHRRPFNQHQQHYQHGLSTHNSDINNYNRFKENKYPVDIIGVAHKKPIAQKPSLLPIDTMPKIQDYDNSPVEHSQAPSISDVIIDDHREDDYENEEGEVIQESNSLPVIPGQYIDYPTSTAQSSTLNIPPFLNMPSASAINELTHMGINSSSSREPALDSKIITRPFKSSGSNIPTPQEVAVSALNFSMSKIKPEAESSSKISLNGSQTNLGNGNAEDGTNLFSNAEIETTIFPSAGLKNNAYLSNRLNGNSQSYIHSSFPVEFFDISNKTGPRRPSSNEVNLPTSQTERPFDHKNFVRPLYNNTITSIVNDIEKDSEEIFDFKESINPHNLEFINNLEEISLSSLPATSTISDVSSLSNSHPKNSNEINVVLEEVVGMSPPPLPSRKTMSVSRPSFSIPKPQKPNPNGPVRVSTSSFNLTISNTTKPPPASTTPALLSGDRISSIRNFTTLSWPKLKPSSQSVDASQKRITPRPTKYFTLSRVVTSPPSTSVSVSLSTMAKPTTQVRLPSLVLSTEMIANEEKNILKKKPSLDILSSKLEISATPSIKVKNNGNTSTNASLDNNIVKEEMLSDLQKFPDDILVAGSEASLPTDKQSISTSYFTHKETVTVTRPLNITTRTRLVSKIILPTKYITNTKTLTVTTTKTTVIKSQGIPSTQTLLFTTTQTSTLVDTVTETQIQTLLQPTKVILDPTTTTQLYTTVTTVYTIPPPHNPEKEPTPPDEVIDDMAEGHYSETTPSLKDIGSNFSGSSTSPAPLITHNGLPILPSLLPDSTVPSNQSVQSHDSIFVVMTDQRNMGLINLGGNHEEELSKLNRADSAAHPAEVDNNLDAIDLPNRDEDTINGESNHVLLGGVLIASPPKASNSLDCRPDCKGSRNELCQNLNGHMRCVCRAGFARMFPDRPCKPTYTYQLSIPLQRFGKEMLVYNDSLSNKESEGFFNLASLTHEALDRMVMQSDFRDIYHGVQVTALEKAEKGDGIIGKFYLQLSDNSDEQRLIDVFRKYLRGNNYSVGGTELYSAQTSGINDLKAADFNECLDREFHDCSPSAQCFNLHGTYTCSCQEGFADLSENPIYPGRICSTEQIGCEKCHFHGSCYSRDIGYSENVLCECFPWYAGASCQLNLKILLIALVACGALLLVLLLFCLLITCTKRRKSRSMQAIISGINILPPKGSRFMASSDKLVKLEKRAMIKDSSSEASHSSDTLPFVAKKHLSKETARQQNNVDTLQRHNAGSPVSDGDRHCNLLDQNDRSLTVMIPRAKYHPGTLAINSESNMQTATSISEAKLLGYLDAAVSTLPNLKKLSAHSTSKQRSSSHNLQTGALVSAGFEVSATVSGQDLVSTLDNRSHKASVSYNQANRSSFQQGESHSQYNAYKKQATVDSNIIIDPVDAWSGTLHQADLTASDVRSYGETTIQPQTKSLFSAYGKQLSHMNNDEANTMAERDIGSTFLLPHTHLYKPDRGSDDISGFDSF